MIPEDNRFESDPADALPEDLGLPDGWVAGTPDRDDRATVERLTELLRDHERAGRGWAGSTEDEVLVEVSERGAVMRENLVVRDPDGRIRAWGSVHDRAVGRMLFVHVVDREIDERLADRCSDVLFAWAEAQARAVGAARGRSVQQVDEFVISGAKLNVTASVLGGSSVTLPLPEIRLANLGQNPEGITAAELHSEGPARPFGRHPGLEIVASGGDVDGVRGTA